MAEVEFWEKPGCINNTRQKQLLRAAGHAVKEHDLLTWPWEAETLRAFFGSLPVSEWFNRNAPAIKAGRVIPESLDECQAIGLMLADPLLIRRPLMQVGDERRVGFAPEAVERWIGLQPESTDTGTDLESCPREPRSSRAIGGCA